MRMTCSVVFVALCCTMLLVACGDAPDTVGVLTYSVAPREGGLVLTVADNRPGQHTVWIVVTDAQGRRIQDFGSFNHGTSGSGDVEGDMPLEPATYGYVVYDRDGIHYTNRTPFEAPEHLIDEGEVEVL
jgi:hypothetical protein